MANSSTSSAHTPGPWSVEREDGLDGWKGISVFSDAKLRIANLVMQLDNKEMVNARLIAAAPELLEVLEYCCGLLAEQIKFAPVGTVASKQVIDAHKLVTSVIAKAA